jgi:hypothetical protein
MTDKRKIEAERARLLAKFYRRGHGPNTPRELIRQIAYELRAAKNEIDITRAMYAGNKDPSKDIYLERKRMIFRDAQHRLWGATKMFELCMKEKA